MLIRRVQCITHGQNYLLTVQVIEEMSAGKSVSLQASYPYCPYKTLFRVFQCSTSQTACGKGPFVFLISSSFWINTSYKIQKEPATRKVRWKRAKIYKIQEWIFLLLDSTDTVKSNCLVSVSVLRSPVPVDHGHGLLDRPHFEKLSSWEFYKIVSFAFLFPWLQGPGCVKICLFPPFSCFHLPVCVVYQSVMSH